MGGTISGFISGFIRPMRPVERGNALVLAMLILLTLTSVGILSVQQTNTDLMVSGNLVRSTQAGLASEAGLTHALAMVSFKVEEMMLKLDAQRRVDPRNSGLEVLSMSTAIPDRQNLGQQSHIPIIAPAGEGDSTKVRLRQDFAYDINATWLDEVKAVSGYDVNSEICHQMFDFNSRGAVPSSLQSVEDSMRQTDTVVVESRARALIGPSKCRLP